MKKRQTEFCFWFWF